MLKSLYRTSRWCLKSRFKQCHNYDWMLKKDCLQHGPFHMKSAMWVEAVVGAVISQRQLFRQPIPHLLFGRKPSPPWIALLFSSLALTGVCVMHIHSLTHIYTLNAPCSVIVGIFHSAAAGEHCSQLCCQLQYMLKSQRLFADILILPTSFFCLPSCVWIQARTQLWGQKSTWRASVLMSISSKTLTYKLRIARITKKNFMQRSMCAF